MNSSRFFKIFAQPPQPLSASARKLPFGRLLFPVDERPKQIPANPQRRQSRHAPTNPGRSVPIPVPTTEMGFVVRRDKSACRAGRLAVVVRAIGCFGRCTIGFVLFAHWVLWRRNGDCRARPQSPQTPAAQQAKPRPNKPRRTREAPRAPRKKGEWLLAPIPISSPAIGSGLEFAVARVFSAQQERRSQPDPVGSKHGRDGQAAGKRLALVAGRSLARRGSPAVSPRFFSKEADHLNVPAPGFLGIL